jgi:hypothetical protein
VFRGIAGRHDDLATQDQGPPVIPEHK